MSDSPASVAPPLTVGPAVLPLAYYGDPILRKKAKLVASITPALRELAARMIATMYEHNGVGLAAPQVGKSVRLLVLDTRITKRGPAPGASTGEMLLWPRMPLAVINPEIVWHASETEVSEEGCLSLPEIHADVIRPSLVVVRATTLDATLIEVECGGLLGRCFQHEIDHLNGTVFPDRISKAELDVIAGPLRTLEERTRRGLKGTARG